MIDHKDIEYMWEVASLDGSEYGEYIGCVLEMWNDGYPDSCMSDTFKEALEKEIKVNIKYARENCEIEEYEVVTQSSKRKRLKYYDSTN